MTDSFIVILALGAAAGGFINGLAGTGTALFSLGFYLTILPPMTSIAMASLLAILGGFHGLWAVRSDIMAYKSRLWGFLIPGLIGVPLGIALLDVVDATTLRILIAVMLIVYGGYFAFRSTLPTIDKPTPVINSLIALVGGVLGGLASLSGAVPVMWLSMRPWPKGEIRAVLQPFNMVVLFATATLLFFKGAYDETAVTALMIAIPVSIIASLFGLWVFSQLTNTQFRRLLIGLSLLTGLGVFIQVLV